MIKHLHRSAAFLLSAALLLTSTALCGCNKNNGGSDSSSVSDSSANKGTPVYSPTIPDNPIDESIPGKDLAGTIGTAADYDGKVSVTLNNFTELDAKSGTGGRVFVAEMTVTNNSSEKIDCSTGTHFTTNIDGETSYLTVIDVSAAIYARQYYTTIGKDAFMNFNQAIEPGQTVEGYVALKAPATFKDLKLIYTPYKYYSNDTVTFSIAESDITHYKQSFGPAQ